MSFFGDLALILKTELNSKGYTLPASPSDEDIVKAYLIVLQRQIPLQPRVVEESAELICPPERLAGYNELKRKASAGEPLKANQSKTVNKPDYYDVLFIDWGIQHFHLGTTRQSNGFVERTGLLLYARVTQDKFYAIQFYEHGAWSKQDLLQILQKNWPAEVEKFELKGLTPVGPPLTDQDVANFRKAGVQPLVTLGDKVIAPMGGGYTSSGDSTTAVRSLIELRRYCGELEAQTRSIIAEAATHGHKFSETNIKLVRRDNKLLAMDQRSKTPIAACDWPIAAELQ
jgi:hypothetical protein